MKKTFRILGIVTIALVVCAVAFAQTSKRDVIYMPVEKLNYKEIAPGISKAVVWGDHDAGAYGAFTEMRPGLDAGMHTHSNEMRIVVLRGAYIYKDADGEKRVGPGSFIRIPARRKHWSGSDPREGAWFFEESTGKFDLVATK